MVITAVTINGQTLYIVGESPSGRVNRYSLALSSASAIGYSGVLRWLESQGPAEDQPTPPWLQQLVGAVVPGVNPDLN